MGVIISTIYTRAIHKESTFYVPEFRFVRTRSYQKNQGAFEGQPARIFQIAQRGESLRLFTYHNMQEFLNKRRLFRTPNEKLMGKKVYVRLMSRFDDDRQEYGEDEFTPVKGMRLAELICTGFRKMVVRHDELDESSVPVRLNDACMEISDSDIHAFLYPFIGESPQQGVTLPFLSTTDVRSGFDVRKTWASLYDYDRLHYFHDVFTPFSEAEVETICTEIDARLKEWSEAEPEFGEAVTDLSKVAENLKEVVRTERRRLMAIAHY